jgi:hypothetical protein
VSEDFRELVGDNGVALVMVPWRVGRSDIPGAMFIRRTKYRYVTPRGTALRDALFGPITPRMIIADAWRAVEEKFGSEK